MKKLFFAAAFAVFAMLAFANTAYAQEQSMVSVMGEASVIVTPDVAHIWLGVDTQHENAHTAQQLNSEAMSNVIAAVLAMGIDESDVQTVRFNMWPIHSWDPETNQSSVSGFSVSNSINVTVRDLEIAGDVLSAASQAGANTASSVTFGLLDSNEVYNQALALAVADATAKARVIASALGQSLGAIAHVTETGGMGFMPLPIARAEMAMDSAMSFAGGVPVQSGELAVTARVQITFYLR